jgi:type IV pilus assembly protein PilM
MSGGKPRLVRVAQVPTPAGAVASGEIRDPEQVSDAIRELWRSARFRSKDVMLGVGNQRVVVRDVSLPWLEDKEFRQSLPFQVQEFVPIPVDDAVLDYHVIEEFQQEGRRMLRLLLVAAQKFMIDQMIQSVEGAGLNPVGLDLVPFAILRSVATLGFADLQGEEGEEAVVDVGADVTSVCVHAAGVPRFVRVLPAGGREITSAVAKLLNVPEEEAERLKRGATSGVSAESVDQARQAIGSRAASFVDEIRSSLDFYASQTPGARINRVLLTGGGSKLRGLMEMLDERLSGTVGQGHPFHGLTVDMQADERLMGEVEPLLAVAVGLAIPGAAA